LDSLPYPDGTVGSRDAADERTVRYSQGECPATADALGPGAPRKGMPTIQCTH